MSETVFGIPGVQEALISFVTLKNDKAEEIINELLETNYAILNFSPKTFSMVYQEKENDGNLDGRIWFQCCSRGRDNLLG